MDPRTELLFQEVINNVSLFILRMQKVAVRHSVSQNIIFLAKRIQKYLFWSAKSCISSKFLREKTNTDILVMRTVSVQWLVYYI